MFPRYPFNFKLNDIGVLFWVTNFITMLLFIFLWGGGISEMLSVGMLVVATLMQGFFYYRNNAYFGPLILALLYLVYSAVIGRYLIYSNIPFNDIVGYENDWNALFIIYIFSVSLLVLLERSRCSISINSCCDSNVAKFISLFSLGVGVLLQVFFLDTEDILSGDRAGYSPLYEYSVVFFIIALYYSNGQSRVLSSLVLFVCFVAVARDFYYGHRVTGLQLLLSAYAFYGIRYYRSWLLVSVFVLALFVLNYLAVYRVRFDAGIDSFFESAWILLSEYYMSSDTAIYAYVASLTFLNVQDLLSYDAMASSVDFSLSLLLPGGYGTTLYELSKKYFEHQNGGLLPIYIFFYYGYLGLLSIVFLIVFYLSALARNIQSDVRVVVFVYVFATAPRWLVYAPTQLIKGVLIVIFCTACMIILSNSLVGKCKRLTHLF